MRSRPSSSKCPAENVIEDGIKRYVDECMTGKRVIGKLVRQCIQRYVDDEKNGDKRGLFFDKHAATRAVGLGYFLRHFKGKEKIAGKPFAPAEWQAFCEWNIFGWKRLDEDNNLVRRFRTVYAEIAKKNGKSTWGAKLGIKCFLDDGVDGPEVYSAATSLDQANIVWQTAYAMLKRSPELSQRTRFLRYVMECPANMGIFRPLAYDEGTIDGHNPSCSIIDELHRHPHRGVWDVLKKSSIARSNGLTIGITTAGWDQETICYEVRDYATKILSGATTDDRWFPWIATVDDNDNPLEDESCWIKANPNLGDAIGLEELRDEVRVAREVPAARNNVLRLHFNVWTQQNQLAIDMNDWNACSDRVDQAQLAGRTCYGGLDLSLTGDLTAFVLVFPPSGSDELWSWLPHYWLPEETIEKKVGTDLENHQRWVKDGYIEQCRGGKIEYALVESRILEASTQFNIMGIAYDPYNAEAVAQSLSKQGMNMMLFAQNYRNYTMPVKHFLKQLEGHQIAHGGHPVLKWNASNAEIETDKHDNYMFAKPQVRKTTRRIDGIPAGVMATAMALINKVCDYPMAI